VPDFRRDPQETFERKRQWQPLLDDLTGLRRAYHELKGDNDWLSALHRCEAVALGVLGEWGEAGAHFIDAARLMTGERDVEIERGLALVAVMAPQEGQNALACVDRALKLADGDGSLWYLRACLLQKQRGKPDELLRDLSRAIERNADHAPARMERGQLLLVQKRLAEAEADFSAALNREKVPAVAAHVLRARARIEQNKWPEALVDLDRATELEPREPLTVLHALLIREQVPMPAAKKERERRRLLSALLRQPPRTVENDDRPQGMVIWAAVLFPPADPSLADWLMYFEKVSPSRLPARARAFLAGAARCRLGQWEEALKRLEQACREDPDGGTAHEWYFLALTHLGLKQSEKGREALKKARAWTDAQKSGRLKNIRFRDPLPWDDQVELKLLDAEAARLLDKPS